MIKAEAANSNVGDKDTEIGSLQMALKLADEDKAEAQRIAAAQVQTSHLTFARDENGMRDYDCW